MTPSMSLGHVVNKPENAQRYSAEDLPFGAHLDVEIRD